MRPPSASFFLSQLCPPLQDRLTNPLFITRHHFNLKKTNRRSPPSCCWVSVPWKFVPCPTVFRTSSLTCKQAHVGLARLEGTAGLSHHLLALLLQRRHLGKQIHVRNHEPRHQRQTRDRRPGKPEGRGRETPTGARLPVPPSPSLRPRPPAPNTPAFDVPRPSAGPKVNHLHGHLDADPALTSLSRPVRGRPRPVPGQSSSGGPPWRALKVWTPRPHHPAVKRHRANIQEPEKGGACPCTCTCMCTCQHGAERQRGGCNWIDVGRNSNRTEPQKCSGEKC